MIKFRMTNQREIILEELRNCQNHPTADELYQQVAKRLPRISLATVYRNLEILTQLGLIRKIAVSGRRKRFEWDLTMHNHIYCISCHRIDDIRDFETASMPPAPKETSNYMLTGYRIEFFGLCPECKKQTKTI